MVAIQEMRHIREEVGDRSRRGRDRSRRRSEGQEQKKLLLTLPGAHLSRQPTATCLAEYIRASARQQKKK